MSLYTVKKVGADDHFQSNVERQSSGTSELRSYKLSLGGVSTAPIKVSANPDEVIQARIF